MEINFVNLTKEPVNYRRLKKAIYRSLASVRSSSIMELGVVFITPDKARVINQTYRRKNYIPGVLTFGTPLNEILICPKQAGISGQAIEELVKHGLKHLMGKHHR